MNDIEYVIGDEKILQQMPAVRAWRPFDERIVNFCDKLSECLLSDTYPDYPDIITMAFWLRKSNLKKVLQDYRDTNDRLGRGLAFHIAPGNIALSFAYSLVTGLLTGNANIVRLPSRRFEQTDIFCAKLREILSEDPEITQRICLIRYPHDKSITDKLSIKCQTRVIWGGDTTINTIRQSPLSPRATEITFANRFSVCLINADTYLSEYEPSKTAHKFYIDTYLTDQNACSSPRIIFWFGKNVEIAKKIFWKALHNEIRDYNIAPVTTVNKLMMFCKFAADNECSLLTESDYKIMRVSIKKLNQNVLDDIVGGGYFYEYDISDLNELLTICTIQLQTFSYIGFDGNELQKFILFNAPVGVDRIVPVGNTMNFGLVWDGRDIVREMTRKISLQ